MNILSPPPLVENEKVRWPGLRFILASALLAAAIIPLVMVSWLYQHNLSKTLSQTAFHSMESAAIRTSSALDAFFQSNLQMIGTESQLRLLSEALTYCKERAGRSGDGHEMKDALRALESFNSKDRIFISEISLLDLNGNPVLSTSTSPTRDLLTRSWFQETLISDKPTASALEFDGDGWGGIYFAAIVRDHQGVPAGVLQTRYASAIIQHIVVSTSAHQRLFSLPAVVDENGFLVNGTAPNQPNAFGLLKGASLAAPAMRVSQLIALRRLPPSVKDPRYLSVELLGHSRARNGTVSYPRSQMINTQPDGRLAVVSASLQFRPWSVIVAQPEKDFLQPLEVQNRQTMLIGLLLVTGIGISAVIAARRLARPVVHLTQMALRIASGDLQARAEGGVLGEIGLLAQTFDAMACRLEERDRELKDSRRLLQDIVDNSSALISVKDLSGNYLLLNKAFQSCFGAASFQGITRGNAFGIDLDTRSRLERYDREVLVGKTCLELEESFETQGQSRTFLILKFPLIDSRQMAYAVGSIGTDITLRKEDEQRLRVTLQERETLLKEIHHRVKNNLQVVSSLLNLAVNRIEDAPAREIFLESQSRVRAMALVHEKLYQTETLASIGFLGYTRELVQTLTSSYIERVPRVYASVEGEEIHLPIDLAIPCGLIVNELVVNAFKHAFPDGREGQIRVSFRRDGETLCIIIEDDGKGLPEGFDPAQSHSLGMQLVGALVRQSRASLTFHSEGSGTRVEVCVNVGKI